MVELEPVPEEEHAAAAEGAGELEAHGKVHIDHVAGNDDATLKGLIERHLLYTGSERARAILENWAAYLPQLREGDARTSTAARSPRWQARSRPRARAQRRERRADPAEGGDSMGKITGFMEIAPRGAGHLPGGRAHPALQGVHPPAGRRRR